MRHRDDLDLITAYSVDQTEWKQRENIPTGASPIAWLRERALGDHLNGVSELLSKGMGRDDVASLVPVIG